MLTALRTETLGWNQIEVVLDSGAADSVCPRDMCPHFPVEDSESSKAGVYYTGANGGKLFNLGQTHVPVALDHGARSIATFQVADVHNTLLSITRAADAGYECHLKSHGGYLLDTHTGETVPIARKGNLYVMRAWIKQDPFGRRG